MPSDAPVSRIRTVVTWVAWIAMALVAGVLIRQLIDPAGSSSPTPVLPPPPPPTTARIGEQITTSGPLATVESLKRDGSRWIVTVHSCAAPGTTRQIDAGAYGLQTAAGRTVEPAGSQIGRGDSDDCARGEIAFAASKGKAPVAVLLDDGASTHRWISRADKASEPEVNEGAAET